MLNINENAFDIDITRVESPFPIKDPGHKGQFWITNHSGGDNTLTGYTASFLAVIDGKEILLKEDRSDEHDMYSRVSGGTFLFMTDKNGVCIDEINLCDFPVPLPDKQGEPVHFYFRDIDILQSLETYGITSAQTAREKGCSFKIRLEIKLAESYPSWNMKAEKTIEIA